MQKFCVYRQKRKVILHFYLKAIPLGACLKRKKRECSCDKLSIVRITGQIEKQFMTSCYLDALQETRQSFSKYFKHISVLLILFFVEHVTFCIPLCETGSLSLVVLTIFYFLHSNTAYSLFQYFYLLAADFRQDLTALFVMNLLIKVPKEFSAIDFSTI